MLQVSAVGERGQDRYNYIGVFNDAEIDGDLRDQPKPPAMYPDKLSLSSNHQDWGEFNGNYSGDFQATTPDGNYWDLTLETGASQNDIYLNLNQMGSIPENHSIKVLNLDLRYQLPGNDDQEYTQKVYKSGSKYLIRVLVGDETFMDNHDAGIGQAPTHFDLSQNFPNPFNGDTRIKFDVPEPTALRVVIYDLMGRQVRELVNSDVHAVGYHEISWDGKNELGHNAASGIYLISLQSAGFQASRKMVLLK